MDSPRVIVLFRTDQSQKQPYDFIFRCPQNGKCLGVGDRYYNMVDAIKASRRITGHGPEVRHIFEDVTPAGKKVA